MKKIICFFTCFLAIVLISEVRALASENNFLNFGPALSLSMKTFPPTPSIGASGGAWVGLTSPYSSNPASYIHIKDYGLQEALYTEYAPCKFKRGPDINLTVQTGIFKVGKGALRIDYFNLSSSMTTTKMVMLGQKIKASVNGRSLRIGYGYPISDKLSIGISTSPIYDSDVKFKANFGGPGITLSKGSNRIRENFRAGGLYSPQKWLHFGVVYEYNRSRLETKTLTGYEYKKIITHPKIKLLRPGISINPWRGATFTIDYLYSKSEIYSSSQFFVGLEQYLNPFLAVRTGVANKGFTIGFGLRWKNLFLDYAYLSNPMSEMEPFFGSSSAHMITLTITTQALLSK